MEKTFEELDSAFKVITECIKFRKQMIKDEMEPLLYRLTDSKYKSKDIFSELNNCEIDISAVMMEIGKIGNDYMDRLKYLIDIPTERNSKLVEENQPKYNGLESIHSSSVEILQFDKMESNFVEITQNKIDIFTDINSETTQKYDCNISGTCKINKITSDENKIVLNTRLNTSYDILTPQNLISKMFQEKLDLDEGTSNKKMYQSKTKVVKKPKKNFIVNGEKNNKVATVIVHPIARLPTSQVVKMESILKKV